MSQPAALPLRGTDSDNAARKPVTPKAAAKAARIFAKLTPEAKKNVEAYGLGYLHGAQSHAAAEEKAVEPEPGEEVTE